MTSAQTDSRVDAQIRETLDGGVWRGGKIVIDGEDLDAIQVAIHTCVAQGWMEMVKSEDSDHE